MKFRLSIFTAIIALACLSSCEPSVGFNSAQPAEGKDETSFPSNLIGKYADSTGTKTLIINPQSILLDTRYDVAFSKAKADSLEDYILRHDSLIAKTNGKGYKVIQTKDSIYSTITQTDTVFNMSALQVLRKYKGQYLLNQQEDKNSSWQVQRLSYQHDLISLARMATVHELDSLTKNNVIEPIQIDTTTKPAVINPTRKQFRKLLKSAAFTGSETFKKIK